MRRFGDRFAGEHVLLELPERVGKISILAAGKRICSANAVLAQETHEAVVPV
jgi:hypothetical protein